jgi:hypothetical protein
MRNGWLARPSPPGPSVQGEVGWFQKGDVRALVAIEPAGWHVSLSCADRYPTWDEIKDARYSLAPDDVYMAMILPPSAEYVNVHTNCFHLHQIER